MGSLLFLLQLAFLEENNKMERKNLSSKSLI